MAAARRINLNRLFSSLTPPSSSNTVSKTWVIGTAAVRSEYTDRIVKLATQQSPQENQDQETVKKQEKEEITHQDSQNEEEDDDDLDLNKETGEIGGPKGPEPTRFGDWERNDWCMAYVCCACASVESYCSYSYKSRQPVRAGAGGEIPDEHFKCLCRLAEIKSDSMERQLEYLIKILLIATLLHLVNGVEQAIQDFGDLNEPVIRFPFRIQNRQSKSCGYPGFETISCGSSNETILELPFSGKFAVQAIDYARQEIQIYDQKNCLADRILSLNLSGSPFHGLYLQYFMFFNCSPFDHRKYGLNPVACLSGYTYTVFALSSSTAVYSLLNANSTCDFIKLVYVPVDLALYQQTLSSDLSEVLYLTWEKPRCGECESRGGRCALETNSSEVVCSNVPHQ
ncbi:RING/U-BOX SUPERFAMILY PROTEIN, partial [Salix viminalis]